MPDFLGLADDIARLALQRLLQCDVRWRSNRRVASRWQLVAITLGLGTAILSSLAAFAVAQGEAWREAAIYIALSVAVLAPLQAALSASDRMERHRAAATTYELLANELDRYLNLELGPPMWRGLTTELADLPNTLEKIDSRIENVAAAAYHVDFRDAEISAAQSRAQKIVDYLQMKNVEVPPREVWAA